MFLVGIFGAISTASKSLGNRAQGEVMLVFWSQIEISFRLSSWVSDIKETLGTTVCIYNPWWSGMIHSFSIPTPMSPLVPQQGLKEGIQQPRLYPFFCLKMLGKKDTLGYSSWLSYCIHGSFFHKKPNNIDNIQIYPLLAFQIWNKTPTHSSGWGDVAAGSGESLFCQCILSLRWKPGYAGRKLRKQRSNLQALFFVGQDVYALIPTGKCVIWQ